MAKAIEFRLDESGRGNRQPQLRPGQKTSPRKPFPVGAPSDFSVVGLTSVLASEHLAEQEDYLWGV